MSRLGLLLVFLGGVCGTLGCEVEVPSSGTLRVLTYNVAGLPQGISGSNPEVNIAAISPLLNPYDLVLVQEDFVYHDDLVSEIDHPYQTESATPKERLMHDGLNRFSRVPFSDHQREQWGECFGGIDSGSGDCLAEKGFSVAITEVAEGILLHVYNLHVEAGGGLEDNAAREAGIEQLIQFARTYSEGEAVLVGGDFNLHGFDPIEEPLLLHLMEELELRDSCRFLQCERDLIDRVLFRSGGGVEVLPVGWAVPENFVDEEGERLSDHNPVNVDFSWRRLETP